MQKTDCSKRLEVEALVLQVHVYVAREMCEGEKKTWFYGADTFSLVQKGERRKDHLRASQKSSEENQAKK